MSKLHMYAGGIAASILVSHAAEARIVCRDGFQIVGGQEVSTPYCNDGRVAEVAREHGMEITADEIRNKPGLKYEVCRFIGDRVRDYCPESGSGSGD